MLTAAAAWAGTIDTRLTHSALEMAPTTRRPEPGLIHHSDQGVQYACSEYVARLGEVDAFISMVDTGNPYENVRAEGFFRTLKMEEVYIKDYGDFQEAEQNIAQFIEEVYNEKRLHSSLGSASGRIRGATRPAVEKLTWSLVRKMGFTPVCAILLASKRSQR